MWLKATLIPHADYQAKQSGATMRICVALAAVVVGFGVPTGAAADDEIASFNARWPEAAMRKPTLPELVHLASGAIKREIRPMIEAERERRQKASPCRSEICQLVNSW